MKFNLYQGNSQDGYNLIAENVTSNEGWKIIRNWRTENAPKLDLNGNGYYRSHVTAEGYITIDYGSHINFFEFRQV